MALMSGCALFADNVDKVADGAGKLVKFYCENVTIPEVREEIRAAVNAKASPHSVAVECANGGPIMRSADPASVQ